MGEGGIGCVEVAAVGGKGGEVVLGGERGGELGAGERAIELVEGAVVGEGNVIGGRGHEEVGLSDGGGHRSEGPRWGVIKDEGGGAGDWGEGVGEGAGVEEGLDDGAMVGDKFEVGSEF